MNHELREAAERALSLLNFAAGRADGGCLCARTVGWCPTCGPHLVRDALRAALAAPVSPDEATLTEYLSRCRPGTTREEAARDLGMTLAPVSDAAPHDKKARGLYGKFRVERADGKSAPGQKHDGCDYFVLDLTHDPLAPDALRAYAAGARRAGYGPLADDLDAKVGPAPVSAPAPRGEAVRWMMVVYDPATNRTVETCLCADEADARQEAATYANTAYLVGVVALVPRESPSEEPAP